MDAESLEPLDNSAASSSQLSDSQLLVLSTCVYRLDRAGDPKPGARMGDVARAMAEAVESRRESARVSPDHKLSQQMSYAQWLAVLGSLEHDRALNGLEIRALDIDERGGKKLLLCDACGNAYFVFAGTGAGEWADNAQAAYMVESKQQLRACEWFLSECSHAEFSSIVACGHSKGGNKAMYLAVRAGEMLDRAVSFDGQGFSQAFVQAYEDGILQNTQKITNYLLDNDYVGPLLNSVTLHSKRVYIDGSHVKKMAAYHSPYSLFLPEHGASGLVYELGVESSQGLFGRTCADFSAYVQSNADSHEYKLICESVGAALENILVPHVPDETRNSRARAIGDTEGFGLLIKYLSGFVGESASKVQALDVLALLLGQSRRGKTIADDIAIGALESVSSALKFLTRR